MLLSVDLCIYCTFFIWVVDYTKNIAGVCANEECFKSRDDLPRAFDSLPIWS